MKIDNLYQHADGGLYCLLSNDAPYKSETTGEWLPGVVYISSEDEKIRSTTLSRWEKRFAPVAAYSDDDPAVLQMIRRANPGTESGFDFIQTFESWHESEMGITGQMIELAVAAAMVSFVWGLSEKSYEKTDGPKPARISGASLTIKTEDLQHVMQNYHTERVPQPHGFRFTVRKSLD